MTDPLYDKTGDDPALAALEGLLEGYAHRAPLRELPPRPAWRRPALIAAFAAAGVAALVLLRRDDTTSAGCPGGGDGFAFAVRGGAARCAGGVASRGTLPVGAWLETAGSAVADVRIADIGAVTVFGDSRVRLVGTGAAGHHLELARGRVTAHVVAPPRLFVVDTPVASAVDLGCAYDLSVDDDGRTHLRVDSGAVSLESHGAVAYAPLETEVIAVAGRGPGTPVAIDAPSALRSAVARFDGGDAAALRAILELATGRDVFTLWNLLARTAGAARAAVADRLDALSPIPPWISLAGVRAGDAAAIDTWRADLQVRWVCPDCVPRWRAP